MPLPRLLAVALLAMASCVLASWFHRRTRMTWRVILDALAEGTKQSLSIIAVTGPVSILTLAIMLPGTGLKITSLLIELGGNSVALTLALIFVIAFGNNVMHKMLDRFAKRKTPRGWMPGLMSWWAGLYSWGVLMLSAWFSVGAVLVVHS